MSESKKGKISLSGLGKGSTSSSSSTFPSFRFSPGDEEIEEIMLQDPTSEDRPQSLPDSPKQSGGDVSPLKEMLKHKWANKWEKRSLSLDLDFKGKIITAIEDKRKSIFSQFIPEETGIIPPSTSIAEHIGFAGEPDEGAINQAKSFAGGNVERGSTEFQADVEEIGLDYLASTLQSEDHQMDQFLKFNLPPDSLVEVFSGYSPSYYQHPRSQNELPSPESVIAVDRRDLEPASVYNNIISALTNHPWTKYLLAFTAVAVFLPALFAPFLWILVGGVAVIIFQESVMCESTIHTNSNKNSESGVTSSVGYSELKSSSSTNSIPSTISGSSCVAKKLERYGSRSQSWMTEFEGEYDPFTCHVGLTRIAFVRLDGTTLYVSYPNPKHRIPKRPLWNDPPITTDINFVRHCVYDISRATVYIAPERLARKRAWNKKYPIAIRLANHSVSITVSPVPATDSGGTGESSQHEPSASLSPSKGDKKTVEPKKEVVREDCSQKVIYLFSRTDREKDDWFRRLVAASTSRTQSVAGEQEVLQKYLEYMRQILPPESTENLEKPGYHTGSKHEDGKDQGSSSEIKEKDRAKKDASVPSDKSESSSNSSKFDDTPASSRKGSPSLDDSEVLEKIYTVPHSPVFLNAFVGRLFFDFLRSPVWTAKVTHLIQKKLNYIRRPQFLDTLVVRGLDLGTAMPVIQKASSPVLDSQGLWIDLDLTYDGNITLTLETKLNLLKLRKSPSQETTDDSTTSSNPSSATYASSSSTIDLVSSGKGSTQGTSTNHGKNSGSASGKGGEMSESSSTMTISASDSLTPLQVVANMFDSDADDSGESSEDETNPEDFIAQHSESTNKDDVQNNSDGASSKGKKILRMAEKIASSKYVQHATEMKVVKKAIANVANTPLVLSVELKSLIGTLVLNIPTPPTDRLWMGFRHNPSMQISGKPKFGSRAVNLTQVTDWIQKKLLHEFQRVIVFPNMNDVTIPLMEYEVPK